MSNNTYENLQLGPVVNTIPASHYPTSYPLHWHKYLEVAALSENASPNERTVLNISNHTYEMEPGDVLFIWSGELHDTQINTGRNLSGLQFYPALLYELPDLSSFMNHFKNIHLISHRETPELAQALQMYIRQIFDLEAKRPNFCDTEKFICLLEMFICFGKHLDSEMHKTLSAIPSISSDTLQRIRSACVYITDNCDKELSLDSVAAFTGFSPSYFSRVFKQVTKYNFVEYLAIQRVRAAQILLSDTHIPITEISSRAGFKSISTFNRVFRQYKSCSPSEYRKYMV